MYIKLAKRNIERSLREYIIYFLTLVFAVSIFYTFNSIDSQKIMMKLNEYQAQSFQRVDKPMEVASIFISCILGFLIIYANNYLIKRRKKEFGIYLTLGMEPREISNILLIETILIGIFSLGIGLFLGVFLSQGMSIFTARLFHIELKSFIFTFSSGAFMKTIVYFIIIYLIVFLFNVRSITKLRLIDLLTDGRKNEKIKLKSLKISIIIFINSIILIASAYFIILNKNSRIIFVDTTTIISIVLVITGTFLFFFSLSGFLLRLVQNDKKVYLKELNMFILRQIESKINTTFVSMSFVCLMIFMSICMLTAGFSISKTLNKNVNDLPQYDITLFYAGKLTINEFLNKNINLNHYGEDYFTYCEYYSKNKDEELGIKTYIGQDEEAKNNSYTNVAENSLIPIMKLSDFNNIMKHSKKEGITLNKREYAVFGDIKGLVPSIQRKLNEKRTIKVSGEKLIPSKNPVMEITIDNIPIKTNFCTFIVRDELADRLTPVFGVLNLNFKGDKTKLEKQFLKNLPTLNQSKKDGITCICNTKEKVEANVFGEAGVISYLALYIGLMFLMVSALILSLQQLSQSADNIERYKLLKKIGVDEEMLNKSILIQTAVYFMLPLFLALIHSIVGLKAAKVIVNYFGTSNVAGEFLISILIFIVIYGGYFWITYIGVRKMVK